MYDKNLLLSENQDLAQATGSYASSNVLDLDGIHKDLGACQNLRLEVWCEEDFASANSTATLTVALEEGATASLGDVLIQSKAYGISELKAGTKILDVGLVDNEEEFLGLMYTIGGEATTSGKVTAYITAR